MLFKKKKKDKTATPSIHINYIYNLVYQSLTVIASFATTPYISRVIGPDGVGIQSYTNSVVQYFAILGALGTASYGQREIARHRDDPQTYSTLFWEIEILRAVTTAICLAAWIGVILFSKEYSLFYLVLSMELAAVAFDVSWFFGGLEQHKMIGTRNILIKLAGIACLFTFIKEKEDLLLYMTLLSGLTLLGNLSMWRHMKYFLVKTDIRSFRIKRHLKETLIYFIPTIATSIYTILDKTMLGWFADTNKSQNGYYEYSTTIINMGKIILVSFNTVMSSRMSYLFAKKNSQEIRTMLETSLNFILLLAAPIMMGIAGVADRFIPWFLGDAYRPVIPLLYVCCPLVLIVGLSDCMGSQVLTPGGKRAQSGKVIVMGALVNASLNMLLIPKFQASGAAMASVIAETLITGAYLWLSRGYITLFMIARCLWKRLLSAAAMLIFVIELGKAMDAAPMTTLIQIFGGAVLYFALLLLMKDDFLRKQLWKK